MKTKCYYIVCLFFLLSCIKNDDINDDISYNMSPYYEENNQTTTERLGEIMYNVDLVERFKVVHISDIHLSNLSNNNYKNPRNLKEAIRFSNQSNLKINAIVATGDFINNENKTEAARYMNSFFFNLYNQNSIPTFPCYGNHDSNIAYNQITGKNTEHFNKQELYSFFDNKDNYKLERPLGENYYYTDVANPMGGTIRFIALDMLDQEGAEYNTQNDVIYSDKQIKWFCEIALKEKMTPNHSIIILNHYPFQMRSWGNNKATYLNNGSYVHSWNMIPEIVEAFRDKKQIQKDYPNRYKDDTIHIDTDFSNTPGEFICYMGGHAHVTTQFEITDISNRSTKLPPQKMLLCTNISPSEAGGIYNTVKRQINNLSDNSFCIYAIDTNEKKVYITFFGAYKPYGIIYREEYPEVQTISY